MSVQLQILGGETRDIPCDGTPHKLTLDLHGRLVAKLAFWVSSEQDCDVRITNRDSKNTVTVLVPDYRLNDSKPFVVLAHHPPVRAPPELEQPPPPKRRLRSVSLANQSEQEQRRSGTKSYAIGVTNGASYEVRCSSPFCACDLVAGWYVPSWFYLYIAGLRTRLFPSLRCVAGWRCRTRHSNLRSGEYTSLELSLHNFATGMQCQEANLSSAPCQEST